MKKNTLITIASIALLATGSARTWTSADGSKTFEGEFISCSEDSITVKQGLKERTFKLALLSQEDQEWAKAEGIKVAAAAENAEAAEEFANSKFGKAFRKLKKLDGKRFAKHELGGPPKLFLLYISASW